MNNIRKLFSTRQPFTPHLFWSLTAGICLLGLGFRLPRLGRSLWLDEAYSAWFSMLPLRELWTSVPLYEVHPPMYYTLLKGWSTLFGNSEIALRAASVLPSVATILLLALSAKALRAGPVGDRVALLAALLLAVNSGSIAYAQSARPYALETFTASVAILSSLVLLREIRAQGQNLRVRPLLPWMTGLALSTALTMWLHTTAVLIAAGVWGGMAVALLLLVPGNRMRQALVVGLPGVAALLLWVPFLPFFIIQSSGVNNIPFWITTRWSDLWRAWTLAAGGSKQLLVGGFFVLEGAILLWRTERPFLLHMVTLLLLPLSVVLSVHYLIKPIFIDRLFEWMAPPLMALVALGLVAGSAPRTVRQVAALAVMGLSLVSIYGHNFKTQENWSSCLQYISSSAQSGDLVVALPNELNLPIWYYTVQRSGFPEILFIPRPFPARGLAERKYVGNLGAPCVLPADRELVKTALTHHRRVWLIERCADLYDPEGIIRKELSSSRRFAGQFNVYGISLTRFD